MAFSGAGAAAKGPSKATACAAASARGVAGSISLDGVAAARSPGAGARSGSEHASTTKRPTITKRRGNRALRVKDEVARWNGRRCLGARASC